MDGDVAISHAVRIEAFVGLTRERVHITSVVPLPGRVSWGYEIFVGDECFMMSANVVLDVIYCQQTIESAGEMLLECAERAATILQEPSNISLKLTPVDGEQSGHS